MIRKGVIKAVVLSCLLFMVIISSACTSQKTPSQEIDATLDQMSDEDLQKIAAGDTQAIAGKAVGRVPDAGFGDDADQWKVSATNKLYERQKKKIAAFKEIVEDLGGCVDDSSCEKGFICKDSKCVAVSNQEGSPGQKLPSELQLPNGCSLLDDAELVPPTKCLYKECTGFDVVNGSIWTYSKSTATYCIKQKCVESTEGENVYYGPFTQLFCK